MAEPLDQSRPPVGPIVAVLTNLRRRVTRQSRDVIESAVSQLFDAAVRHPDATHLNQSGEYRIDELARLAGTTTRNVRAYRDRGLLHPPLRVGRITLYNDTHLTRLRLVTSLLERGYNIAHVHEMLSAWEQGKDLGEVLGLESALVGTWASEKSQTMSIAEARELIDDDAGFERLLNVGLVRIDDEPDTAVIVRPTLIAAFNEVRGYGVPLDRLIDVSEATQPHIDAISEILVEAGFERVREIIKPGVALALSDDTEIAELITMLVRFRTQAVAAVTASLADSIETTIESLVGKLLAEYVAEQGDESTG